MREIGFVCMKCNRDFTEAERVRECDGLDTPPYRYTLVCPYCGNDDLRELVGTCDRCGKVISEEDEYYTEGFDLLCEACAEEEE